MTREEMLLYGFLYVTGFIVAILLTRAIFGIGAIVRNLKAQTAFLYHMAKAQGVSEPIINEIAKSSEIFIPKEDQLVKPY